MSKFVCFGELMLRLTPPGYERLLQSPTFEATFGGAEANVAVSLSNYGLQTSYIGALPVNELGDAALQELRRYGVDTQHTVRQGERLGVYYLERGAAHRPASVVYDRAGSAMATARPGDFDWSSAFDGAGWLHTTGITPAISASAAQLTLEAVEQAKKAGLTVSLDLNHREKLWKWGRGAAEVLPDLLQHVDVLIAGREDIQNALAVRVPDAPPQGVTVDLEHYEALSHLVLDRFDNLSYVAITLRESHSAEHNVLSACLRSKDNFWISNRFEMTSIIDRIGGGDSFAAGLIYGLFALDDLQQALDFAAAAYCLKHSIPGDFNLATTREVERLMTEGGSGRVRR